MRSNPAMIKPVDFAPAVFLSRHDENVRVDKGRKAAPDVGKLLVFSSLTTQPRCSTRSHNTSLPFHQERAGYVDARSSGDGVKSSAPAPAGIAPSCLGRQEGRPLMPKAKRPLVTTFLWPRTLPTAAGISLDKMATGGFARDMSTATGSQPRAGKLCSRAGCTDCGFQDLLPVKLVH